MRVRLRERPLTLHTRRVALIVAFLLLALPTAPAAHEIPSDVTIRAFVRPDGERLHLLIRVRRTASH